MRVPQPGMLCGHCGLPVLYHTDRVKEMVPGPDGAMRMQLFHAKRCWPRERRKRMKEKRRMERNAPPPTPEPEPTRLQIVPEVARGTQRRSGIGLAIYDILDHIPEGQEWTIEEIIQRLAIHNFTTTKGSVTQTVYTYKAQRRQTETVRIEGGTRQGGHRRVFVFTEPPPGTPARSVSYHKGGRKSMRMPKTPKPMRLSKAAKAEQRAQELAAFKQELEERPVPAPPALQTTRAERVAPAAAPSLTRADINRAFNDFQAFLLETLADFRNELMRKCKS